MTDRPFPHVPPSSSALRELAHAVAAALTLPVTASDDELAHLRLARDRARLVMLTMRRIASDREACDQDVMAAVISLREQAAGLPARDRDRTRLES